MFYYIVGLKKLFSIAKFRDNKNSNSFITELLFCVYKLIKLWSNLLIFISQSGSQNSIFFKSFSPICQYCLWRHQRMIITELCSSNVVWSFFDDQYDYTNITHYLSWESCVPSIVKIDSRTWSFCLRHIVQTVYLSRARKLNKCGVKTMPS